MTFDVITSVNEITMSYDLTHILSVMIGCSATLIAIIGGLIANRAISDKAEQESIERQLQQVDTEYMVNEERIQNINTWLNEYDAKDFIDRYINDILDGKSLFDVYDSDNDNEIEYDELLPYWNKCLKAVKLYHGSITENYKNSTNNDMIPKKIINDLDDFQYEFCSHYGMKIYVRKFAPTLINHTSPMNAMFTDLYNKKVKELEKLVNNNEMLDAKSKVLEEQRVNIYIDGEIKSGMKLFAAISTMNIILPTTFMLFNPTSNKNWYYIETILSLITFSAGIITMIKYIYSLFPNKKENTEETESKNEQIARTN